jgi:hypothetical protein
VKPPLTKREARIARAYQRYEKAIDKAQAQYARADRLGQKVAEQIFKLGKKLSDFTKAVRISDEGKHLLATDQYAEASHDIAQGGDGKIWAHAAARKWKLATKNLD